MAVHLSFAVGKYSYATGSASAGVGSWQHHPGTDICVVVRGSVESHASLKMQIVHRTTILESIAISDLIDQSLRAQARAAAAGEAINGDKLPILGITKDSLLALKYNLENGLVRRLQVRLGNPEECQEIAHIFHQRGMQFQEVRPRTGRPGTASSRPDTAQSLARPVTAQPQSRYFQTPITSNVEDSQHPGKRPYSSANSFECDMVPPPLIVRDNAPATRPSLSSTSQQSRLSQSAELDVDERRRNQIPISDVHTASTDYAANPRSGYDRDSFDISRSMPYNSSSDLAEPRSMPAIPLASTNTTTLLQSYLQHETPLTRPESQGHRTEGSSSPHRPVSALALPPLRKPKMVAQRSSTPTSNHPLSRSGHSSSSRPTTAPQQPPPLPPLQRNRRLPSPESHQEDHPFHGDRAHVKPATTSQRGDVDKPIPMNELLARKRVLTERSNNTKISRFNSLADAPHEIESPPWTADSASGRLRHEEAAKGFREESVGRAYAAIRPPTNSVQDESLEQYAMQTPEDRQAVLDQFMIDNLENPSFTTLCEDVENCWRRIALGL